MTSYLIVDGYNVIGALDRYAPGATGGLDESRELLVNDALKAAGWTGRRIVVVLDGVTDPQNLGAALRVADGAGASGVVIPKDRAAGVTAAAVKASAGASEHVPVARVTNLRRAVDLMKEAGLWVYAAEVGGRPHTDLDLTGPVGLVLGSEGRGVRRLVREGCDGTVSIPMLGAVGSLNVSVASAVLLYEARRQRGR